jgi:hypothetical protein
MGIQHDRQVPSRYKFTAHLFMVSAWQGKKGSSGGKTHLPVVFVYAKAANPGRCMAFVPRKNLLLHEMRYWFFRERGIRTMKKVLFLSLILIVGILAYIMSFTWNGMQSSETFSSVILPPMAIYLFFGAILFIIVKKGYDFMLFR